MPQHKTAAFVLLLGCILTAGSLAHAQQLTLNPHLNYGSDSNDGPLITGNDTQTGVVAGKPNYIMIYGEGCYNSKRQARRTVALADRYKDRVNFIVIDLDHPQSPAQLKLVQTYYQGSIPDLIVLDGNGKPVYNQAGEQNEDVLSHLFDTALKQQTTAEERH